MKKFDFLLVATDKVRINTRAYSTEENLRSYMEVFQSPLGVQIDKKVDDIIKETKSNGKSEFKATNTKLPYSYVLFSSNYIDRYMDFGAGNTAKMTKVER